MLAELFQKSLKIQSRIAEMRKKLAAETVEAVSADGGIKVVASCDKQIVSIEVLKECMSNVSASELATSISRTSNEALKKAEEVLKRELSHAMDEAGINLPGLF